MQNYNSTYFENAPSRVNTGAEKYTMCETLFGSSEVLPLWIADMDFPVAREITDAIKARAEHPIYGYTEHDKAFYQAAANWFARRHKVCLKPENMSFTPGVVPAINLAILAMTQPGDKIIIQPPVYPPFFAAVRDHNRQLLTSQILDTPEGYKIDFDDFEAQVREHRPKLFIFCQPHNPLGKIWSSADLARLADICLKYDVIAICDMIHADLTLDKQPCPSLAAVSPEMAQKTITLFAPSKTFNIAGLSTSIFYTDNQQIKEQFDKLLFALHLNNGNIFGTIALTAAYNHAEPWLDAAIDYINHNFDLLDDWLKAHSFVKYRRPEASYLAWLDFSPTGLKPYEIYHKMSHEAFVGLNPGSDFSPAHAHFMRMNLACPAPMLLKALDQIAKTFN